MSATPCLCRSLHRETTHPRRPEQQSGWRRSRVAADRQDGCLESEGRAAAQQTGSLVNDSHSPPPRPSHEPPPPPPPLTTPTMRLLIRQSPVGRETEITCSVTLRTRRPLVTKALCVRTNAAHRLFLAMGEGGAAPSRGRSLLRLWRLLRTSSILRTAGWRLLFIVGHVAL